MYILIVGGGKVGLQLARVLSGDGHEILVVERDRDRCGLLCDRLEESAVVLGDGTDPRLLRRCGIERADAVVAVTGKDEVNFVISHLAKKTFGVARVVARVNNPDNENIFNLLDLGSVVNSTNLILAVLNEELHIGHLVKLFSLGRGQVELVEVDLLSTSDVVGKEIRDIPLPEKTVIMAVIREEEVIVPGGSTSLREGDRLLALTQVGKEEELKALFGVKMSLE